MIQEEVVILTDFQMKSFNADDYFYLQCWG